MALDHRIYSTFDRERAYSMARQLRSEGKHAVIRVHGKGAGKRYDVWTEGRPND